MTTRWIFAVATLLLLLLAGNAFSQAYPAKSIRLVLPFSPGGGTDALARIIGPRLGEAMGQNIVIDNRVGAAGNIAADIVAKSVADGYTIFLASSMLTTNQSLFSKLSFDPVRDFAPVTHLGTGQYLLVVYPAVPAKNVAELIALAKAKPGGLNYASPGIGVAAHLAAELLKMRAGIDMVHIAYKGGGPAASAMLAGEAQVWFGTIASSLTYVKAGRLRALAVTSLQRSKLAPEVPTLDESGLPGFNVTTWDCFVVPAGTPPAVITRIHDETVKVLHMPDIRERIISVVGYEPTGTTPSQLAEFLRTETAMWAKVIKAANIRAD
jgi:tripartite-type tricarboxylate transporter receptor subunit TctC